MLQPTHFDFEKFRQDEFAILDTKKHVYLDFTGCALIPNSLVKEQYKLTTSNIFGNPHSTNPASSYSTNKVNEARQRVLKFFKTSEQHYTVIFTQNASTAIKLVAESYPFQRGSILGLLADNHNSVLGIREYASTAGATVKYAPINSHLRAPHLDTFLGNSHLHAPSLFAYPAQSNFSGVRHSLSYVQEAKKYGWDVLLDVAAYAPTSPLDLSVVQPDFVPVSFYKILGIPTGVGALLVHNSALQKLRRPWFAGGTVQYSSVKTGVHTLSDGHEGFEDGTINYLNIALVRNSLDMMDRIGMENVREHIHQLTRYLIGRMYHLKYPDGSNMVKIYGPVNSKDRGGCVAFDLLSLRGTRRDCEDVVKAANQKMISIRSGCFCNPGAAERALHRDYKKEKECIKNLRHVTNKSMSKCLRSNMGCVRVSVGLSTNYVDIEYFIRFIKEYNEDFAI